MLRRASCHALPPIKISQTFIQCGVILVQHLIQAKRLAIGTGYIEKLAAVQLKLFARSPLHSSRPPIGNPRVFSSIRICLHEPRLPKDEQNVRITHA